MQSSRLNSCTSKKGEDYEGNDKHSPAGEDCYPDSDCGWMGRPGGGSAPSGVGSRGVVVMDDTTCMVEVAASLAAAFDQQSCGQCPACAHGTRWCSELLSRLESGSSGAHELDQLVAAADSMARPLEPSPSSLCTLGATFAWSMQALLQGYGDEFRAHVDGSGCPVAKDRTIKIPDTVNVRF